MIKLFKTLPGSLAGALALALPWSAAVAQAPIKVGDINSYSNMALFTEPYRRGAELAIAEINAAGGIGGRPLQTIFRDDAAKAGDAIRQAEELTASEGVSVLAGGFTSSVCLALADFAQQRKIPFLCGIAVSDAIAWEKGNRYTFHTAASTYMQTLALAELAAKLPAKTWATVAPQLRIRHLLRRPLQGAPQEAAAGRDVRRRAMAGAGQDRPGPDHRRAAGAQPGRHLQRRVRHRPDPPGARGQHPRRLQGQGRGQRAHRPAGIPRHPQGRDAGRLDRHRLPLAGPRHPRAQGVPRSLREEVQGLSALGAPCSATSPTRRSPRR